MKKILTTAAATAAFLVSAIPALAAPQKATFLEWTWPANIQKNAYFMKTGSGIVQGWSFEHPTYGDARFIYKPLNKFKNAAKNGCDEGYLKENTNWNPQNLYNVIKSPEYKSKFDEVFNRETNYLMCVYPM